MNQTRRRFLSSSIAASVLAGSPVWGKQSANKAKLDRLACNSWPFRAYFDTPGMTEFRDKQYQLLTQAEFPQFLADHFGIHNVEFLKGHFAASDAAAIEKVKAGLKKAQSRCCNLMDIKIPGGVYTKGVNREAIVKEAEHWAGVAVALGSPSITIALDDDKTPDVETAADNLRPAVDAIHRHGIKVLFHNDDIKRESAEILTAVIGKLGRDRTGTCPDFGNFATRSSDYALSQLRMLAPYASNICHAKDGIANGKKFYGDDFAASMKVMQQTGFHGVYSLEFEGLGTPLEGVGKLLQLTEKYMA